LFAVLGALSCALAFPAFVLLFRAEWLDNLPLRMSFFLWLVAMEAVCLAGWTGKGWWGIPLAVAVVVNGAACQVLSFAPGVSSYPLSLGWSEASRYFYASQFLGERIYGLRMAWPVLHPSRYFLQAAPFLLDAHHILVHRLWQVALWLVVTALGGMAIARRMQLGQPRLAALVAGWAFLFLFQGPVYYHLLLSALPVLLWFDRRRPARTMWLVVLGSAWAGLSRINWFPVPGFLAAVLYLLDTEWSDLPRASGKALVWPAAWVLAGGAIALATNTAYVRFSGNPPAEFASSLTSDLLWYRLLPSATYPPGVLTGIALVSAPLAWILVDRFRRAEWRPSTWPLPGLALVLGVFLAGGLVVSTKIGGGGNLHNLDAYLLFLLVIGGTMALGRAAGQGDRSITGAVRLAYWLALFFPALLAASAVSPFPRLDFPGGVSAVETLRGAAQQTAAQGHEVLFLHQRQLQTFGLVEDVPLVPEYEKVYLMEMAMANNQAYLQRFYADLHAARFGLIVSDPLNENLQGRSHAFGEENDVWAARVAGPLLDTYQPLLKLEGFGIWLLVPRGGEGT
jgi:hypothetical protein